MIMENITTIREIRNKSEDDKPTIQILLKENSDIL